jgi:hypothetical protein
MGNFICNDCSAEISSEWKNAVIKNECPGCGGTIMSEEQQELIDGLSEALKEMPNDAVGVAGWIVCNYRLQKIGDCMPVEKFHDKNNKTVSNTNGNINKVSDFFKRGGYDIDKIKEAEAVKRKALNSGGDITEDMGEATFEDGFIDDDYSDDVDRSIEDINSLLKVESNSNNTDTAKARAFLEQHREKQLRIQKNIAEGIGAVSRSGNPAGFRRSS